MSSVQEALTIYWPFLAAVIAFIVSMIIFYVNVKRDVKDLIETDARMESRLTANELKIEAINPVLLEIQKQLVAINTKLEFYFKEK